MCSSDLGANELGRLGLHGAGALVKCLRDRKLDAERPLELLVLPLLG